ncbi:hypothetical protein U0070_016178, partial [Myodes glareolus]
SLLTFGHQSTTARVITESVPPQVAEGENVLFIVHNLPKDVKSFGWFKGLKIEKQGIAMYRRRKNLVTNGPMHSGRETIYRNGSLLLEKVSRNDTGFYTLQTYNRHAEILSTTAVYLHVHDFLWKCGRLATSSQPTIESVPSKVVEWGDVLLLVHNPPENIVGFVWVKGMNVSKNIVASRYIPDRKTTMLGPAYSGREILYSDGSLLLRNVTPKDSGLYTLEILRTDMTTETAQIQLKVHKSVTQPFMQMTDTTVAGCRFVTFTCISPDTDISVRWIFNNETLQLTERMTLSPTKCGLRINPVKSEDAGEYQCEVSN